MSRRFLITLLTVVIIGIGAAVAIVLAKGYRFSPQSGTLSGTGIISVTSIPDQASVYLDGHLTTATNANINSLIPKTYTVKIVKEGFIPWEKKIDVKEGFVSNIKATLFRSIPTIYPLTYNGATNISASPDGQRLIFVVPGTDKKSGIWIWTMSDKVIGFARGGEPHQITNGLSGIDFSKAIFRWSPEAKQLMAQVGDTSYLLDVDRFSDPPRDITAINQATLNSWKDEQKDKDLARLITIKDLNLRKLASDSASIIKWAPDETKFFIPEVSQKIKIYDLVPPDLNSLNFKSYNLPYMEKVTWLPDSTHLIQVEQQSEIIDKKAPSPSGPLVFPIAKVSVFEFDGNNKSEIYAGTFDPNNVYAWPDASRLVIVSSFATATANQPNLFGINLK